MEAYLDNAATTKAAKEVVAIVTEAMLENYGNPSSKHIKGVDAEHYIRESREKIAKTLKCEPKEIIFTSGGTEANNLALIGTAMAKQREGKTIITSSFEHASVYNPLLFLEGQGFTIKFAPVDSMGHIDIPKLVDMVDEDTILVSVMYVNNEVGSILQVADISKAIKKKKPDVVFHVDAIQAYGKIPVNPKREGIDMLSVSGHKFHGPKGSGFLYVKQGIRLKPIIYGGGQQSGMRSGTENVPAIAGIGVAAEYMCANLAQNAEKMYELKKHFIETCEQLPGVHINAVPKREDREEGWVRKTAPHVVSVSFDDMDRSEVLLHALEDRGVYVSSGSACSSNHPGISGTLKAVGVKREHLDATLRFSFCDETTLEEVDYAVEQMAELLPVLRRFRRK